MTRRRPPDTTRKKGPPKPLPASATAPAPADYRGPGTGSGRDPVAKGLCAHGCGVECTPEDYCFGCRAFICNKHPGDAPWGNHGIEAHNEEPDED
jgi:hypothetical protein